MNGAATKRAVYKPFGEATDWTYGATATEETKGFIGERYDADAGLQYLNARYYDPKLGIFIQPDWFEVTLAGVGTNRYSYSGNDPINFSDPGGNLFGEGEFFGKGGAVDKFFGGEARRERYANEARQQYDTLIDLRLRRGAGEFGNYSDHELDNLEFAMEQAAIEMVRRSGQTVTDIIGDASAISPQGKLIKSGKAGVGTYKKVKGHHIHAKAGFKDHPNYDPKTGFSVSAKLMDDLGIDHKTITRYQRQAFDKLARSGRQNTMREHTRIAVEALEAGGANPTLARQLVAKSLRDLRSKGVRNPTNIPWN